MNHIFQRLFDLETWRRVDWFNAKWNKTKEEVTSPIAKKDYLPITISLVLAVDYIAAIYVVDGRSPAWLKIFSVLAMAHFIFVSKLTSWFDGIARKIVIGMTLVLMVMTPIVAFILN